MLSLYFVLQGFLAILGLVHFHIELGSTCLLLGKKKVGWDFDRDCLEFLYWGVIAILTVLSLSLHEYNFFLFKCLISFNNILESSVYMFCTSFKVLPKHLNVFDINESKMLSEIFLPSFLDFLLQVYGNN